MDLRSSFNPTLKLFPGRAKARVITIRFCLVVHTANLVFHKLTRKHDTATHG